jgi:hypothetical protein
MNSEEMVNLAWGNPADPTYTRQAIRPDQGITLAGGVSKVQMNSLNKSSLRSGKNPG